jgi:hypothetical protein
MARQSDGVPLREALCTSTISGTGQRRVQLALDQRLNELANPFP